MLESFVTRVRAALAQRAAQPAAAAAQGERMARPRNRSQDERSTRIADALEDAGFGADMLVAPDFPTSILDGPPVPPAPLLTAYATRAGLLAAIVYSEALAPPIALR